MHVKSIAFTRQHLLYSLMFAVISTLNLGALAQATNQAIYLQPGLSSQGAAPPPPGDGMSPAPVTPGDTQRQNVPTGSSTANPEYGTYLDHSEPRRRSRTRLLMGGKVALIFQPDQLTNEQKGQIQGIIGGGGGGQPYQDVNVSEAQLVEMQQVLAPSPDLNGGTSAVPMPNGTARNQVFSDTPAGNTLSQNGSYNVKVTLPVVQRFSRYLVILGAVFACIFLAFSAISLQFGDRSAGGRIIGSAAGIMLLFMAFAIWKVIRQNEITARGPLNRVVDGPQPMLQSRSSPGDRNESKSDDSFESTTDTNLPATPANPGGTQRSGLPLEPLGAAH